MGLPKKQGHIGKKLRKKKQKSSIFAQKNP
jgi:hypothetical protein